MSKVFPMKTWAAGDAVNAADINSNFGLSNIFGGLGTDGALTITSGVTTIDLALATVVEKNYSSISITGTGSLAFSNPNDNGTIIVLKSVGDMTLTSSAAPMIDVSNCGAKAGAGVTTSGTNGDGTDGTDGYGRPFITNHGVHAYGGAPGIPGTGGLKTSSSALYRTLSTHLRYYELFVGAGGGGGGTNSGTGSATSGPGGRGGGCLIIECGGAWNFTTANGIKVGGQDGTDGTVPGSNAGAGGGGGGGGGMLLALYNSLTANTGTVVVAGGVGGKGTIVGSAHATGAGGGGSFVNDGSTGTDSTSTGTKTGGDGAPGFSLIQQNTCYS